MANSTSITYRLKRKILAFDEVNELSVDMKKTNPMKI